MSWNYSASGPLRGAGPITIIITLLLIGLSFALGFVVGRGSHKSDLADQTQSIESILRQELAKKRDTPVGKQEFKFYEKLVEKAKAKPPASQPPRPMQQRQPTTPVDLTPKSGAGSTTNRDQTKAPVAAHKQGAPDAAGAYTLQVGSFRNPEAAARLQAELKGKGVESFVHEVDLAGKGHWWRVHVGRFDTADQAKRKELEVGEKIGQKVLVTRL